MEPTHSSLTTPDGLGLHLQRWPAASARGTVLIVHGLGEHSGRYAHVAAHLNRDGWDVLAYDHRGHGRSDGGRGQITTDDALLRDLGQVLDTQGPTATGPLVLLGHSMGGLVAARYVAEGLAPTPAPWYHPVDRLVLSSPALAIPMKEAHKAILATLGRVTPNLAVSNGLKPEWVSRDPKVVAAYVADPLVHDRITPRLANFFLKEGALTRSRAAQWRVPTLLLFGGNDRCVLPSGSREFSEQAPRDVVSAQEFPALSHEIFNEPEQAEVLAALSSWLQPGRSPAT